MEGLFLLPLVFLPSFLHLFPFNSSSFLPFFLLPFLLFALFIPPLFFSSKHLRETNLPSTLTFVSVRTPAGSIWHRQAG